LCKHNQIVSSSVIDGVCPSEYYVLGKVATILINNCRIRAPLLHVIMTHQMIELREGAYSPENILTTKFTLLFLSICNKCNNALLNLLCLLCACIFVFNFVYEPLNHYTLKNDMVVNLILHPNIEKGGSNSRKVSNAIISAQVNYFKFEVSS